MKLATEQYAGAVDPDAVDRTVSPAEAAAMAHDHVAGRLHGVTATCARSATCLYTVTPDRGFIVDSLPGRPAVLMASACSGHGFKHSAAVGELLAGEAMEAAFRLDRFSA